MRGRVLLLDTEDSRAVYAEYFRANRLLVSEAARLEDALKQADLVPPDVIVTVFAPHNGPSVVRELRSRVDHATSIIVASGREDCEQAHEAGADSFLLKSAHPSKVLYEVHRALILRRSGRRLPWNWRERPVSLRAWW